MLIILYSCLYWCVSSVAADAMIGPGKWNMLKIEKLDGDINTFVFDICQRKYNRTHDVFQGTFTFNEDLTDFHGVKLDVCKHVDGGCKQYQVISENCFGDLIGRYADQNFKDMFRLAGIENPEFPIKKGTYEFDQYLWDWDGLPSEGPWGSYKADCCVMEAATRVGCLSVDISFEKTDDDEEDEEK